MKLINRASKKLVCFLAHEEIITREDSEIYRYGIEVGIMMAVNVVISTAISIWAGMLVECLLFLFFYIPVRSYAGGYHAATIERCTLWSQVIVCMNLAMVYLISKTPVSIGCLYCLVSYLIHIPGIVKLAPREADNKPLNEKEKEQYKKYTKRILAVQAVIGLAAVTAGKSWIAITVADVMLIQHILMLIQS